MLDPESGKLSPVYQLRASVQNLPDSADLQVRPKPSGANLDIQPPSNQKLESQGVSTMKVSLANTAEKEGKPFLE